MKENKRLNKKDVYSIFFLIFALTVLGVYVYSEIFTRKISENVLGESTTVETTATPTEIPTPQMPEFSVNSFVLSTNRKWIVKNSDYEKAKITAELNTYPEVVTDVKYKLEGTDIEGIMKSEGTKYYTAEFSSEKINPGKYNLISYITKGNENIKSNPVEVNISYPLFVTWTLDWEGYSMTDERLDQLDKFSVAHSLPLTHFFNPRIYGTDDYSKATIDKMTNWVKMRKDKGDEIGMHLHMFYDMVEAAGVTPKKETQWDDRGTGSDVPGTAYSQEEYSKILAWGKKEFKKNGLGDPKGFRAGGWAANSLTLKAIEDNGFVYDSSGRDAYEIGKNKIKLEWNLNSKTKPYYPSFTDVNNPSSSHMKILEVPNNGGSSWDLSDKQLLKKFTENFTGDPLDESQVLTYLSHPHAIEIDIVRLEPVFLEIEKSLAKDDTGPIIYSTVIDTIAHKK